MASGSRKRLTHDAYTVALICPLEVELSAVRYMLDEEHERLPPAQADTNMYILGQLSGHNVVVASLPAGFQGKVSAASVAPHMIRTFPMIKLRLLVGIGGGVPSKKVDVRLGDVVVSMPSGTHGGVVQYDLGKQTSYYEPGEQAFEGFVRKGFLCPPPVEWLVVLPQMQSDHRVKSNRISEYVSKMLAEYPKLAAYKRPPPDTDLLFQIDYLHKRERDTCEECDRSRLVDRSDRDSPDQPTIHYGLIASGDTVMKDTSMREKISKASEGAICFEMEAAGLMNDFHCMVIRGISDYSDSHKNDIWHPYAAAAAAGLAKEMLSYITPPGM
jgi:nucleoside phosphorylase